MYLCLPDTTSAVIFCAFCVAVLPSAGGHAALLECIAPHDYTAMES
jgi:hypothetical protein